MYKLHCPKCGALPEKAQLKVVALSMNAAPGFELTKNGYSIFKVAEGATKFEFFDELVACAHCGAIHELKSCLDSPRKGLECVIAEGDQLQVRTPLFPAGTSWVRIVDTSSGTDEEIACWTSEEWANDERDAMAEILRAIKSVVDGYFRAQAGRPSPILESEQ
jgi:hypothetical protein